MRASFPTYILRINSLNSLLDQYDECGFSVFGVCPNNVINPTRKLVEADFFFVNKNFFKFN